MRIYNLSKSLRDEIESEIDSIHRGTRANLKDLKIAELEEQNFAIIFESEEKLYLGRKDGTIYFPLLKDQILLPLLPSVTVDVGAIKFVTNGANIMRPGIVSFEGEFQKNEFVVVKEAGHQKSIAIGRAPDSRTAVESMQKGLALVNLHYVGDKFWEALKAL